MTRIIARNSSPSSTKSPAALKKARIRNSTECTGLRAAITITPDATATAEKSQKQIAWMIMPRHSPVGRVERKVLGDLRLPAVAVRQELFLVVEEHLARLGGELEVRPLDDRVHGTRLLAEAAIDALRHVDVVARRAPAAVGARLGLDGDGERGTDRLAQLAGDAALLAVGIAAERMLAAEARRERPLLEGIVHRHRLPEHVLQGKPHPLEQLGEEDGPYAAIEKRHRKPFCRRPSAGRRPSRPERRRSIPARTARAAGTPSTPAA